METTQISLSSLIEGAKRVGVLAEEELQEAEKNATFSTKVIDAIKEEQLHRLMLPQKYGGPQVSLRNYMKIIKTVSKHNMAAGWLTYFYGLHNVVPAFLPEKGMDEVAEQGMVCDIIPPVGKVVKEGDGFRLSGTWDFVSGVLHSNWAGLGALVELPDGEGPEHVLMVVPTDEIEIIQNWDPLGLRPTGSNRVVAENVHVPLHRIMRLGQAAKTGKPPVEDYDPDYPYYDVLFYPAYNMGFAAISLAGAERVLEEFKNRTEKRVRVEGVQEKNASRSQRVLAELTTKFLSAEALMEKYIDLLETKDRSIPREKFFAMRTKIIKDCAEIAVKALLTLGAMATRRGDTVEVFTRDLLTVATHKTSLYEDAMDYYGQNLFGFESLALG